jgi:DnaK suppressor protein
MPTIVQTARKKMSVIEKELASQRNELCQRIDQHQRDVLTNRETDDEMAAAVENQSKNMMTAILERERRTLKEIETALTRVKKGEYGICGNCGVGIPRARLEALPWARLCVGCAERSMNVRGLRVAF